MLYFLFIFKDLGLFFLRLILGLVLVVYGWPKVKNLKKTGNDFAGMGFKPGIFWGAAVGFLEFFGGLLLAGGFFTQLLSLFILIEFAVILLTVNWGKPFRDTALDWLILAGAAVLMTSGGGSFALDNLLNIWLLG